VDPTELNRFNELYQRHLRLLKLHGNAKKMLFLVQLILHVVVNGIELRPRPVFKCPCCKSPMVILGFGQPAWKPG
jgi:hypothetical protein